MINDSDQKKATAKTKRSPKYRKMPAGPGLSEDDGIVSVGSMAAVVVVDVVDVVSVVVVLVLRQLATGEGLANNSSSLVLATPQPASGCVMFAHPCSLQYPQRVRGYSIKKGEGGETTYFPPMIL